jgi:hypothetical protein
MVTKKVTKNTTRLILVHKAGGRFPTLPASQQAGSTRSDTKVLTCS